MQTNTEPETAKDLRTQLINAKDELSRQFPDKSVYVSYSVSGHSIGLFGVMIGTDCGCGDTMQEASTKAIESRNKEKSELIRRAKEMGLTVTEGAK